MKFDDRTELLNYLRDIAENMTSFEIDDLKQKYNLSYEEISFINQYRGLDSGDHYDNFFS